jgi:hypothetical protein
MLRGAILIAISVSPLIHPYKVTGINPKHRDALELRLSESKKNELFPTSRDYGALLTNSGTDTISIEAVQMAGGYAGSGRFYACSVQFWKPSSKKWATPRPAKLQDFGRTPPHVVRVELKPGDILAVCNSLLPQQQGHLGDSVRFALSLQWDQKPTVFSKMFKIVRDGDIRQK